MSYKSATEQLVNEKEEVKSFRLATVSALFSDGCPKIKFFGEETASEKKYKVIEGTSYSKDATVIVGIVNDGYVVLGTINYETNSGSGYLTSEEAQVLFATKDHSHSNYAASSHGHSSYAFTSHSHSEYAASSHKHNRLYADPSNTSTEGLIYDGTTFRVSYTGGAPGLGNASYKWGQIYSTNSAILTSDENEKHDIEDMDERYELLLKLLKPSRYKFNVNTSDRYHTGFTSQGVKKAMDEAGISDLEFAAFIKSPKEDDEGNQVEEYIYGLRYEEFIAPITMMIQKLLIRVEQQEKVIKEQDRRLLLLEGRTNNE